jgi:hypothetical protein
LPYELAAENIHEKFRESVLSYFSTHRIKWWLSKAESHYRRSLAEPDERPTGDLNSSQLACINHLDPARRDRGLALALAKRVEPAIVDVLPVEDDGYVAYEWIGERNYLGERGSRVRGAHVTSLDALMVGRRKNGICLLVFEWKYLECYDSRSVATSPHGTDRVKTYAPLLGAPGSPILVGIPKWLFYEPYCQLMRQTLLAWQMTVMRELGGCDWIHINVIPEKNLALRNRDLGSSPQLKGATMCEAWRSVLREPERFKLMSPGEVLPPELPEEWEAWRRWLKRRYLT